MLYSCLLYTSAIGEGEDPAVCPACGYELGKRAKTVYYVKRVIGLPGDVIDIIDDKVYLNGSETPLEEPYLAEEMNQGETCLLYTSRCV